MMQEGGFTPRPAKGRPQLGSPSLPDENEGFPSSGRVRQSAQECLIRRNRHSFDGTGKATACHISITAKLPVAALAKRIKAAQRPEIQAMTAWLKSWNQPTDIMPGHCMTGMMENADAVGLSKSIAASQEAEIKEMQDLLAQPSDPSSC